MLTVVVLAVAVVLVVQHRHDIVDAADRLTTVDWRWLVVGVVLEALSMVAFGRLQQRLFNAGGGELQMPFMLGLTTAANSISSTLPGGVAFAAAWEFEQLEQRRIPRAVRVWAFVVAGVVSSFTLFLLVVAGVMSAGGRGPLAGLRWLAVLLTVLAVTVVAVGVARRSRPVLAAATRAAHLVQRAAWGRRLWGAAGRTRAELELVGMGPLGWVEVLALGVANWVTDCGVLVVGLVALHVRVPWDDLLVVYGFTQIGAAVNITPGGLGVVAGSLTGLLTAYGVGTGDAIAVTILYRLLTFWVLVPIGWIIWIGFEARAGHHMPWLGRGRRTFGPPSPD